MKASRRSAQKPAASKSHVPSKAAQARSRRAVAEYKKFVNFTVRELEHNRCLLVTIHVVQDPCIPGAKTRSLMIKGPPYVTIES